jgi:hypothetical protein
MPEMFQQALWVGRTGPKGEEQEVAQDLENRDRTRKSSVPVLFRQFERGQMKGTGSSNPLSPLISLYILPTLWRRQKLRAKCGVLSARNAPERAGSRRVRWIRRASSPCEIETVRFSAGMRSGRRSPNHASPRDRKLFTIDRV